MPCRTGMSFSLMLREKAQLAAAAAAIIKGIGIAGYLRLGFL